MTSGITVPLPGTSKATSTPGPEHSVHIVSTHSESEVSCPETESDNRAAPLVMSGLEEMASSEDSNIESTADLEGFHQHILMYCAKRFAYSPPIYHVRNLLAVLDHNMHADRPNALNKDGTVRLQRVCNKKSGRWSIYPLKESKKYAYIDEMLAIALKTRLEDKVGIYKLGVQEEDDPRRLAKHLVPEPPKATKDIFEEQKSRFK